jgi:spore coat protein U-like protein
MRYFLVAALIAFCSFAWSDAEATTVTGTFNVQVIIQATCVLNSATNLSFGTVGVLGAPTTPINDQSTITVTCTNSTPYNIGLDKGAHGGSVTTRAMKGATSAATVTYSLFSDPAMTMNWGQTIGTDTVAATGNGSAQPYPVYGQILAQATPIPDTYTDTITVTVTY